MVDFNAPTLEFFRIMGAVLAANILAVVFFWSLMQYTRLERDGRHGGAYLAGIIMVFGFLFAGLLAGGFFHGRLFG